ncbi:MAG: YggS family pyridoxal phosphate-dependent enzyme [Patescibacteria group bacterium]|nr:YggS family pyridoxal phosphate-dependent enzyme [Patescibacteria group bacterium]
MVFNLKNIPLSVKVMAVTKNRSEKEISEVLSRGIKIIGENRIQESPKIPGVKKHFIGHLQSNKVKKAVENYDVIETVDSLKLAEKISNAGGCKIFIQVNISREPQKSGAAPENLEDLIQKIKKLQNLELTGLMAIIENTNDPQKRLAQFRKMKDLQEKYSLSELSMGMSNDWEEAIESGATIIRLGRILFENA